MTVEPPCLRAALCPLFNELIKVISHEATPAKTQTQHSVFSFLFFLFFKPHLAVLDKIGVDGAPSVPARPPLQVVHVGLVSLRRADDDRRLRSGTVAASAGRRVGTVGFLLGQEELVALVALHAVERWRRRQCGGGGREMIC